MEEYMMGFVIALISGALMSVQGVFNTDVTKATSIWVANCWVQITAFLVCLAAWFFTGKESFITYTVIRSVDSLGPAKSALLIVIAQLATSYLIELFGLFGMEKAEFEWRKLIGLLIAVAGIIVFKK